MFCEAGEPVIFRRARQDGGLQTAAETRRRPGLPNALRGRLCATVRPMAQGVMKRGLLKFK